MQAHNKTGKLDRVKAGRLLDFNEDTLFMIAPYASSSLEGDAKINLTTLVVKHNWLDATALLIRGDNELLATQKAAAEAASKASKLVNRTVEKERKLFEDCQASIMRTRR